MLAQPHKTDQDGVSEDENLPYGQNTTAAAAASVLRPTVFWLSKVFLLLIFMT